MDKEKAHCYPELKTALLLKFDISPETYRQQFRSLTVPPGESPTETYHRLRVLYRRWIRPKQHTKEEIGETLILEQLLHVLPAEVKTWVMEHEPTNGQTAAKLALQHINARRAGLPPRASPAVPGSSFQPFQSMAPFPQPPPRPNRRQATSQGPPGAASSAPGRQGVGMDFVCYYCQQVGHKDSLCPLRKAKLTGACYAPRPEGSR